MILELRNDGTGRFEVRTATGSNYLLDFDRRTVVRRAASAPPLVDFLDVPIALLRRDEEELELLMLDQLKVGFSATLWVQIRQDHVPTLRTTSPVVWIIPLSEEV